MDKSLTRFDASFIFIKSKIFETKILLPLFILSLTNCSGKFEVNNRSIDTNLNNGSNPQPGPSDPQPTPPADPPEVVEPPSTPKQAPVSVLVGYGGLKITLNEELSALVNKTYDLPFSASNGSPSSGCILAEASIINDRCCLNASDTQCYGSAGHSDFLFRDVTFGNGRFVAVGGWTHGIVQISLDGVTWQKKLDLKSSNNLIKGGIVSGTNWLGAITFGNGKFVSVGYDARLYYSEDGLDWNCESAPGSSSAFRSVVFTGNGFLAVGDFGNWAFSFDGKTWSHQGTAPTVPDRTNGRISGLASNKNIVLGKIPPTNSSTRVFKFDSLNPDLGWIEMSPIPASVNNLHYDSVLSRFVSLALGKNYFSTNGLDWSFENSNLEISPAGSYFTGSKYLVHSTQSNNLIRFYSSSNGVVWERFDDSSVPDSNQSLNASASSK